ncbi:hypothetical protein C8E01_10175 [Pontibacter virosus]|uniref:Uncharacterized protein n=1 Tax=Pontibacter virosus TaxID=1765052 RepID=A0A2U1B4W3_9BACT|nr:hypothetical protein C8E01_10175 [Pontibacter virosus]
MNIGGKVVMYLTGLDNKLTTIVEYRAKAVQIL